MQKDFIGIMKKEFGRFFSDSDFRIRGPFLTDATGGVNVIQVNIDCGPKSDWHRAVGFNRFTSEHEFRNRLKNVLLDAIEYDRSSLKMVDSGINQPEVGEVLPKEDHDSDLWWNGRWLKEAKVPDEDVPDKDVPDKDNEDAKSNRELVKEEVARNNKEHRHILNEKLWGNTTR